LVSLKNKRKIIHGIIFLVILIKSKPLLLSPHKLSVQTLLSFFAIGTQSQRPPVPKNHNETKIVHSIYPCVLDLTYEEEIDNKGSNFEIVEEQFTQEFDKGQLNERED